MKKASGYWGQNIQEGERHALDRMNWNDMIYGSQGAVNGLNWGI